MYYYSKHGKRELKNVQTPIYESDIVIETSKFKVHILLTGEKLFLRFTYIISPSHTHYPMSETLVFSCYYLLACYAYTWIHLKINNKMHNIIPIYII